jgi:hydroxymethylbilane synthase
VNEPRIVMATRRSMLALAQSRAFASQLAQAHGGLAIEELHVVTTGDRIQDRPLTEIGGKGLFVKEIEQALIEGQAHFAVHSIKDVPGELAPGLVIACVPRREDPRDAFLSRSGQPLLQVGQGVRVGTSSARRRIMLAKARPDLRFEPLRGNVDTRMRKVREGVVDATVLACAGLRRLGLEGQATETLEPNVSLPAVGQGALGIECREDDARTRDLLSALHDPETAVAVAAERGVMIAAEGSCQVPIAAYACRDDSGRMWLRAMLASTDETRVRWLDRTWDWPATEAEAEELGKQVGAALRAAVAGS